MAKMTQWWLVSLAVLVIFIIFVHPATLLLPATFSQHSPVLQLLLMVISGLVLPPLVLARMPISSLHTAQVCEHSERLALICTRLC